MPFPRITLSRLRRGLSFWRRHGTSATLRELSDRWHRRRLRREPSPALAPQLVAPPVACTDVSSDSQANVAEARDFIEARLIQLQALRLYEIPPNGPKRMTLVVDSLNKGSLMGGVGTALLFAVHLANARGWRLRIVTRAEVPSGQGLQRLLTLFGVAVQHELEFAFSTIWQQPKAIDSFPDELYLTMSWWVTHAALKTLPPQQLVYLLQEDERMFYPGSIEHLRCSQLLANPSLTVIVNTQLLCDHLRTSGLSALAARALVFEPAFPATIYRPRTRADASKHRLFFYARPGHERNLFHLGLAALDGAIAKGVLDTTQWELIFVGSEIPALRMCDGTVPTLRAGLDWDEYAELVGTCDLGLCLMYTPHPSYPPLDLAASGAVVVTNAYGNKTDLSCYSRNILVASADEDSLIQALAQGIALSTDRPRRQTQHAQSQLHRDWAVAFGPVVRALASTNH